MEDSIQTCKEILRAIIVITTLTDKGERRKRFSHVKVKKEILVHAKIFSLLIDDFNIANELVELSNQLRGEVGIRALHLILESAISKIDAREDGIRKTLRENQQYSKVLNVLSDLIEKYKQVENGQANSEDISFELIQGAKGEWTLLGDVIYFIYILLYKHNK